MLTGASTGPSLDGALARAQAIKFRTPYQTNADLRDRINAGQTRFFDLHLSLMPQATRYGFLGKVDVAVIEAADLTRGGGIGLTSGVGAAPTFCNLADRVLIELNRHHPATILGEIVGVVETNLDDEARGFSEVSPLTETIGNNAEFLSAQLHTGLLPKTFLPIQSGVGDIANSVTRHAGPSSRHPAVRDVHRGDSGFRDRPHRAGARALRQQLLVHRHTAGAAPRL